VPTDNGDALVVQVGRRAGRRRCQLHHGEDVVLFHQLAGVLKVLRRIGRVVEGDQRDLALAESTARVLGVDPALHAFQRRREGGGLRTGLHGDHPELDAGVGDARIVDTRARRRDLLQIRELRRRSAPARRRCHVRTARRGRAAARRFRVVPTRGDDKRQREKGRDNESVASTSHGSPQGPVYAVQRSCKVVRTSDVIPETLVIQRQMTPMPVGANFAGGTLPLLRTRQPVASPRPGDSR
jgi:hypothetical protein